MAATNTTADPRAIAPPVIGLCSARRGRARAPRRAGRSRRTGRPAPAGRGRCPSDRRSSTSPIGMPFGYRELRPLARQPAVTTSSPTLTTSCLRTRSRTSVSRVPRAWRTMPSARVRRSTADTAASWSVRSWIRAVLGVTRVTSPTRPSAVTTESLTRTPFREPAAMTIAWTKAPTGRPITSAETGSKSSGKRGPSMKSWRARRYTFS